MNARGEAEVSAAKPGGAEAEQRAHLGRVLHRAGIGRHRRRERRTP
jgi:hypothetical protein